MKITTFFVKAKPYFIRALTVAIPISVLLYFLFNESYRRLNMGKINPDPSHIFIIIGMLIVAFLLNIGVLMGLIKIIFRSKKTSQLFKLSYNITVVISVIWLIIYIVAYIKILNQ